MTIAITRQVQIDLAIYNSGVERARRAYDADKPAVVEQPPPPPRPCRQCGKPSIKKRRLCETHARLDNAARSQRARDRKKL